ncbi:hypothetical protein B0H17DRAFT_1139073 [Mycena rosella]|uniref:Uncharacterized protein n=1 Tax=Mycena rosella TaxID=1033263 RepID=A0AAD7GDI0_MYCRO|nr:hypothetical protein B0H17DRAFT_1139073 [Mycena rosella]
MQRGFRRSERDTQSAATSGPGIHFTSPVKAGDKRKTKRIVPLGAVQKQDRQKRARERLNGLLRVPAGSTVASNSRQPDFDASEPTNNTEMDWVDETPPAPPAPPVPAPILIPSCHSVAQAKRDRRHTSRENILPT